MEGIGTAGIVIVVLCSAILGIYGVLSLPEWKISIDWRGVFWFVVAIVGAGFFIAKAIISGEVFWWILAALLMYFAAPVVDLVIRDAIRRNR